GIHFASALTLLLKRAGTRLLCKLSPKRAVRRSETSWLKPALRVSCAFRARSINTRSAGHRPFHRMEMLRFIFHWDAEVKSSLAGFIFPVIRQAPRMANCFG